MGIQQDPRAQVISRAREEDLEDLRKRDLSSAQSGEDPKLSLVRRVHDAKPSDFDSAALKLAGDYMVLLMARIGTKGPHPPAPRKTEIARVLAVAPLRDVHRALNDLVKHPPSERIRSYNFFPVTLIDQLHGISYHEQEQLRARLTSPLKLEHSAPVRTEDQQFTADISAELSKLAVAKSMG